jgi:hypothetical protein
MVSGSGAVKGAEYGSVVPFLGTSIGAAVGGLFGGGGDKNNVAGKLAAWAQPTLGSFSGSNILPVPVGQTPLTSLPAWGGAGGSGTAANAQAAADFAAMAGRNPTAEELSQLVPSYLSGDANILNETAGRAQLSAYLTQQQQTPQNIYNQQQQQLQQQYTTNQKTIDPQVSQTFQSLLGRAPTSAEAQYYGTLMASGQDQYQIQQALQQTQEYQNVQNTNFQNQLQGQLQQSNSTYFNQYIAPQIASTNALNGGTQGNSGYQSQLANAALQQNQGLQQFLGGVTAQNYQNSTANATNQYNQLLGQQYGLQNAGVSNQLSNQASNQSYNQQLSLYQMQQQAYSNYLNNYGKTNGLNSVLQGAIGGASAGSKFGPYGAIFGGLGGGVLGGASAASSGNAYF